MAREYEPFTEFDPFEFERCRLCGHRISAHDDQQKPERCITCTSFALDYAVHAFVPPEGDQ